MKLPWYQRSRRRMLLDFHIAEWDPSFLASFDPKEMPEHVKLANATAMTVFANTHPGLCNYPTKVGKMHEQWVRQKMEATFLPWTITSLPTSLTATSSTL
jgi:hypothetical protein